MLEVAIHLEPYHGRTPARAAADIERLRTPGSPTSTCTTPTAPLQWSGRKPFARSRGAFGHHQPLWDARKRRGSTALHVRRRHLDRLHVPPHLHTGSPRRPPVRRRSGQATTPAWRRATGSRPRLDGQKYDRMWKTALGAEADLVTITSAGRTQIEPAQAQADRPGYDGAWGRPGWRPAGRTSTRRRWTAKPARSRVSRAPSRVACGTRPQPVVLPEVIEDRDRQARSRSRSGGGATATAATIRSSAVLSSPASRALTTSGSSPLARSSSSTPSRRGEQLVDEARNARRRSRADELRHDATVAIRLHRGDALHAVLGGKARVRVDVDLRQLDGACATLDFALEHGSERPTRPTPGCPEVDDHGDVPRALDDVPLEVSSVTSAAMFRNNVERVPDHPLERRCCSPRSKRPGCHRARYPRAQDVRGRSRRRANSRPSASAPSSEPNR